MSGSDIVCYICQQPIDSAWQASQPTSWTCSMQCESVFREQVEKQFADKKRNLIKNVRRKIEQERYGYRRSATIGPSFPS